jgi:hypothetical protein
MTDICIPLNNRSTVNNLELRYCLRSIEKHLSGVGNIFIIGHCPDWVQNVIHIPAEEDPRNRFRDRNIMNKMVAACKDERVSNDFLMVHDDHYLLADYEAGKFPYYHMGPMNEGYGQYGDTKKNTVSILCREINDQINNYDAHCPIVFNKQRFRFTVPNVGWERWYGYCLKTLYCVMNGIEGEYMDDIKIRLPLTADGIMSMLKGRLWFSIGDRCWAPNGMKEVLQTLFPTPSKYEKQIQNSTRSLRRIRGAD